MSADCLFYQVLKETVQTAEASFARHGMGAPFQSELAWAEKVGLEFLDRHVLFPGQTARCQWEVAKDWWEKLFSEPCLWLLPNERVDMVIYPDPQPVPPQVYLFEFKSVYQGSDDYQKDLVRLAKALGQYGRRARAFFCALVDQLHPPNPRFPEGRFDFVEKWREGEFSAHRLAPQFFEFLTRSKQWQQTNCAVAAWEVCGAPGQSVVTPAQKEDAMQHLSAAERHIQEAEARTAFEAVTADKRGTHPRLPGSLPRGVSGGWRRTLQRRAPASMT